MGLDSYLFAKRYVSAYNKNTKEIHKELQVIGKSLNENLGEVNYIVTEAMYWRKFSAIHDWFVKNVQHGIDDCGEYSVPIQKLNELLDIIKQCIEDNSKIQELLPPQTGFFFGSTTIDEYFIEELERTRDRLEFLIEQSDDGYSLSFSYMASW